MLDIARTSSISYGLQQHGPDHQAWFHIRWTMYLTYPHFQRVASLHLSLFPRRFVSVDPFGHSQPVYIVWREFCQISLGRSRNDFPKEARSCQLRRKSLELFSCELPRLDHSFAWKHNSDTRTTYFAAKQRQPVTSTMFQTRFVMRRIKNWLGLIHMIRRQW